MEKLGLDKFQDVKLDNEQMSYVYAGACTGGGGRWYRYQVNSIVYEVMVSWDSDETSDHEGCLLCGGDITYYGYVREIKKTYTLSDCN